MIRIHVARNDLKELEVLRVDSRRRLPTSLDIIRLRRRIGNTAVDGVAGIATAGRQNLQMVKTLVGCDASLGYRFAFAVGLLRCCRRRWLQFRFRFVVDVQPLVAKLVEAKV